MCHRHVEPTDEELVGLFKTDKARFVWLLFFTVLVVAIIIAVVCVRK